MEKIIIFVSKMIDFFQKNPVNIPNFMCILEVNSLDICVVILKRAYINNKLSNFLKLQGKKYGLELINYARTLKY